MGQLSRPGLSRTVYGLVNDIEEYNGRVFAGGDFSNVNGSISSFTVVGGFNRTHLFVFDLSTGIIEN
jgi:hypothetical protein